MPGFRPTPSRARVANHHERTRQRKEPMRSIGLSILKRRTRRVETASAVSGAQNPWQAMAAGWCDRQLRQVRPGRARAEGAGQRLDLLVPRASLRGAVELWRGCGELHGLPGAWRGERAHHERDAAAGLYQLRPGL